MDLNPIGSHCSLQSCNVLDLLPIHCSCQKWFCRLHITPDLHDCSSLQHPSVASFSPQRLPKCVFSGCGKPSLATGVIAIDPQIQGGESNETIPGSCPGCQLSFCVHHRHMQSHSCTSLAAEKDCVKHEVARALLSEKFFGSDTPISHTPVVIRQHQNHPPDPLKLAQLKKVNLMKLRHKAIAGDPKDKGATLPVQQRIHARVCLEVADQPTKEAVLWFRKATHAGKVLDLIARHFDLPQTSTLHLEQSSTEAETRVLQNHLALSEQVEDGSTVVLTDSRSIE